MNGVRTLFVVLRRSNQPYKSFTTRVRIFTFDGPFNAANLYLGLKLSVFL